LALGIKNHISHCLPTLRLKINLFRREQHKCYFEACGDLQPARTIFYEQLIAQLIVWKQNDLDILLLGDFNENFYTG
jgi:hypothetical protein